MSETADFPPMNPSGPYGPINLLSGHSSSQFRTPLTITFTFPDKSNSEGVQGQSLSHLATLQTNSGGNLTWQQTQTQPSVSFLPENDYPEATYTVLMTDPDAPTPHDTKYAYWRHWIQSGLRPSGNSTADLEAKSGKPPLTEYLAPGKKEPSADPHRYLVLLYREPPPGHSYHSLTKDDVGAENFEARRAFDVEAWVTKHELDLVAVEWFWGTG